MFAYQNKNKIKEEVEIQDRKISVRFISKCGEKFSLNILHSYFLLKLFKLLIFSIFYHY